MENQSRRKAKTNDSIFLGCAARASSLITTSWLASNRSTNMQRRFIPFGPAWPQKRRPGPSRSNLNLFEQPGGLAMSRTESQAQWDFPYGWAPIQLLAVEGLRRYGYDREADRISEKFLSMVLENFRRDHTIREKYNVVTRSSETRVVEGIRSKCDWVWLDERGISLNCCMNRLA